MFRSVTDNSTLAWVIFLSLALSVPSPARRQTKLHARNLDDYYVVLPFEHDTWPNYTLCTITPLEDVFLINVYSFLGDALCAFFFDLSSHHYGILIHHNAILVFPAKVVLTSGYHSFSHLFYPHTANIRYADVS